MLETGADYTYKPSINKMSKSLKSDQPVYVRLNEKGKEYQANLEKKKVDAAIYDTNGRKLFVPQRVVRSNTSSSESEMGVDEYLYRDAQVYFFIFHNPDKCREERKEGNCISRKNVVKFRN